MYKTLVLLVTLMLFSVSAWAGEHDKAMDKPSMSTSETMIVTAEVVAINHETREVSLQGPEGNTVSFVASEEARNLDQVSVGDTVVAEYEQIMTIDVVAGDGSAPSAGELGIAGRSEKGEMPGAAFVDSVMVKALVEDINIEANTFKLKFPSGEVKEYTARDPENLKRSAVGDFVVITFTEAIALSVEKTSVE
jgi:hypothetical protein